MLNYSALIRFSRIITQVMRPLATYEVKHLFIFCTFKKFGNEFRIFQNAIVALNALQSNASILDQLKKQRNEHPEENLNQVLKFLNRSGLQVFKKLIQFLKNLNLF